MAGKIPAVTAHPASGTTGLGADAHRGVPGPPSDRELAILERVLASAEVPGVDALRDQLRMLQVAPESTPTCRIYLLHPDAPRSGFSRQGRARIPGTSNVRWLDGSVLGGISLAVQDGHLRALQYVAYTGRDPLTLPPAEWVEAAGEASAAPARRSVPAPRPVPVPQLAPAPVPAAHPGAARVDYDAERPTSPVASRRRRGRTVAAMALACALLMAAAFAYAWSNGADVAAAQGAGRQDGRALGAEHGAIFGTWRGQVEGELAGRAATYQEAYDEARAAVRTRARQQRRRQAVLAEREAAAAQAAAAAAGPCPGYYDARGVYRCL